MVFLKKILEFKDLPDSIWSMVEMVANAMTAEFVCLLHHVGMKETNHTLLVTRDRSPRKSPQNVEDLVKSFQ